MGHESSHHTDTAPSPKTQSVNKCNDELTEVSSAPGSAKSIKSFPFEHRDSLRSSRVLSLKTLSSASLYSEPPLTPGSKMQTLSPSVSATVFPKRSSVSRHRRKSSLLNVYNGITGKYISSRICKIAARFWKNNIENMTVSQQLEIGCSIFFGMMAANNKMKSVMQKNFNCNKNIESTSLKYLDMMGWLIRHLTTDKIDLYTLLTKLGIFHLRMGINIDHYTPMLRAMHETFTYYFPQKYSIDVKYAMDEIFSLSAQLMTGQELKCNQHLHEIADQFQADDIPFLKNLDHCLKSKIGRDYIYRYLSQTWCDEMVIFLQSLSRFKTLMTDKERFFVAREITKVSIDPHATFCLNLSYETRNNAMSQMAGMEEKFAAKESLEIPVHDFYAQVEHEVYKLIMDNHWSKFVAGIKELQSKSFYLE